MDNFNISAWKKKQYLAEAGLGSSQAQSLANLINDAIMQVDESLSYRDFAIAVGIILKEEYGSHNFGKFMEVLHAELGIEESINEIFSEEDKQLEKEFSDTFNVEAYLTPFKVGIMQKNDIDSDTFNKMIKWVESKGYKVDKNQSTPFYDFEPGERDFYPQIKFIK
jgi:hypothetical protein